MKGEVQLYIGGVPVELTQDVDILFTYSVDEITNPTVIKNSYSKTITIEDTPNNSQLFGQFWNVERVQTIEGEYGTTFNPAKRVPFVIYVNGDIYQEGYAKLMNVKTVGKNSTYEISLFGGLGSFWYNLSYKGDDNEGDNKRKLSDLRFMTGSTTPSESEFDFVAKKETIQDAWNNLTADTSSIWHYINFMDSYDGYPDDFDADKVLVNLGETPATPDAGGTPSRRPGGRTTSSAFIATTSNTDGTYASYDGYVVAELPKERTAQEMREFRSYLMRPVVRVKEIINACCNPENNGGYTVDLDPSFFSSENPYWEKAWMTLPLLTSMDFNGNEGDDQTGVTMTIGSTTTGGTTTGELYTETTEFTIGTITANTDFNISFDLEVGAWLISPGSWVTHDSNWVNDHSVTGGMYMSPVAMYPCAYSTFSGTYYPGSICIQLVAYSRDGKIITGSEVFNCTSGYNPHRTSQGGRGGATTVSTYVPTPNDFTAFTPGYETTYTTKSGEFRPYGDGNQNHWKMSDKLSFKLKKLPKTCTLKLIVSKVNAASMTGNKAMYMYQRYYTNYTTDSDQYLNSSYSTAYRTPGAISSFDYEISNVNVSLSEGDESIRTGAKFSKADLLNTDYTPAEFFLSYSKLFGLYFEKDKYEDKIYVRTRNTFYRKENVIDLSDRIDMSKTYQITPLVFDAKWYNFNLDSEGCLFGEQYESTYGQPYGIQRVNTSYNFDASEKKLYDGNVFKGGIEALEKSDMFGYVTGNTQALVDSAWKPWMFDGYSYNLYNVNGMDDTLEIEMPTMVKKGSIISYSNYKYYDLFNKLQFHTDDNSAAEGANVLVFYAGSVPTKTWNTGEDLNYWITDDNNYMMTLNDSQPCWLYTTTETDKGGDTIALHVTEIPHFTRYLANGGDVGLTWDFGYPKQIFIPNYNLDNASTLYTNYWQSYIRDMYDVNTKKLSCFVKFDERPEQEWLRDFYWFNNSLWRINKIEDYNVVTQDSAKVEFIKVQDMDNYSNVDVADITGIHISASTDTVAQGGATVTIYVTTTGDWYVSDQTYTSYNASASSGHGNGSFTIQIPSNKNNYNVVHHISVYGDEGQSAWCDVVQEYATLTVTEFAAHTGQDMPWSGGTQMYDVRSTYPWTVTNMDSRTYVTLDPVSGSGGTYANHFECTFDPSNSPDQRNVWMRFTDTQGNYVDVYKWQEARPGSDGGVVNPEVLVFPGSGGTDSFEVLIDQEWSIVAKPSWVEVSPSSGSASTVVTVTCPQSMDWERNGTIVVYVPSQGVNYTVSVIQETGNVFKVARVNGSGDILASGGLCYLEVTSPNKSWTASTSDNFYSISPTTYTASTGVYLNFSANTGSTRIATVTFVDALGQTIVFKQTQAGMGGQSGAVSPSVLYFDATGGTQTVTVNIDNQWNIVARPSWVTLSTTSGATSGSFTVTVDPYSGSDQRNGSIVIYDSTGLATYVVAVFQNVSEGEILAVSPSSLRFDASGGTATLTIISNRNWTIG